jgi:DNA-binding IclR family transcriptional regulator
LTVKSSPDPYFSRAVAKAFQALDLLASGKDGLTLGELSSALKLAKPSAMRLLYTLDKLGHARKTAEGRYVAQSRTTARLLVAAEEPLRKLHFEFRETASLAALCGNHSEVILVLDSPQLVRMGNIVGRIIPPHASSLGKAITAFQTDEIRAKLLRSYGTPVVTSHTITGEIELQREFERIRRRGFAEDREESATGGVCFAAPILAGDTKTPEHAIGAISMSVPKLRLANERRIVQAVKSTAREISSALP